MSCVIGEEGKVGHRKDCLRISVLGYTLKPICHALKEAIGCVIIVAPSRSLLYPSKEGRVKRMWGLPQRRGVGGPSSSSTSIADDGER